MSPDSRLRGCSCLFNTTSQDGNMIGETTILDVAFAERHKVFITKTTFRIAVTLEILTNGRTDEQTVD